MTGQEPQVRVPDRVPGWARAIGWFLAHIVWHTTTAGEHHVPATGPVIFAPNHTGVIDGPLVFAVTPRRAHLLVKRELFGGFIGRVLVGAGQIPVDRSGGRPALMAALAVLRRGDAVGVFPEGNRGKGDVKAVKAGVAWLAVNGDAPVIPVAVLGTRRTGERVGRLPGFRRRLHVEFGAPLTVARGADIAGRRSLDEAIITIRDGLADHVSHAAQRMNMPLPADDPRGRAANGQTGEHPPQ